MAIGSGRRQFPVQPLTKYQLVIKLKTAKAVGLTIPDKLLAAADEIDLFKRHAGAVAVKA